MLVFIILQNHSQCQDDPYYSSKGFELIEIESKFVLNYATTASEVIFNFGMPEKTSKAEYWGGDDMIHQTYFYESKGLEIDLIFNDSNNQVVNSIYITSPSDIKTSRGIGIGSTKEEVLEAYKDEIDIKNRCADSEMLVAGAEFGGVIFCFEYNKVISIFIGAASE